MKLFRVIWRLLHGFCHAAVGYITIKMVFPRLSQAEQAQRVNIWAQRMLQIAGIELVVKVRPTVRPARSDGFRIGLSSRRPTAQPLV